MGHRLGVYAFAAVLVVGALVSYAPAAAAAADLEITPSSADFGDVFVGGSKSQEFIAKNLGANTLDVASIQVSGADADEFTIESDGCSKSQGKSSVPPSGVCTVAVAFAPKSPGGKAANLVFSYADYLLNVPMSGNGQNQGHLPPTPVFVYSISDSFGDFDFDQGESKGITVFGDSGLDVSRIELKGIDAGQFIIERDDCSRSSASHLITPTGACLVVVRFAPSHQRRTAAELVFTDNANDSPQTVPLIGKRATPRARGVSVGFNCKPRHVTPNQIAKFCLHVKKVAGKAGKRGSATVRANGLVVCTAVIRNWSGSCKGEMTVAGNLKFTANYYRM